MNRHAKKAIDFFRVNEDWESDPWGTAMEVFFQVAAHLTRKTGATPREWGYRPGAGALITREDRASCWYDTLRRAAPSTLIAFGNFLNRYTRMLDHAGRSY